MHENPIHPSTALTGILWQQQHIYLHYPKRYCLTLSQPRHVPCLTYAHSEAKQNQWYLQSLLGAYLCEATHHSVN